MYSNQYSRVFKCYSFYTLQINTWCREISYQWLGEVCVKERCNNVECLILAWRHNLRLEYAVLDNDGEMSDVDRYLFRYIFSIDIDVFFIGFMCLKHKKVHKKYNACRVYLRRIAALLTAKSLFSVSRALPLLHIPLYVVMIICISISYEMCSRLWGYTSSNKYHSTIHYFYCSMRFIFTKWAAHLLPYPKFSILGV